MSSDKSSNLKRGLLLGKRYESTTAAESSSPPAERYEYQAEVWYYAPFSCFVFVLAITFDNICTLAYARLVASWTSLLTVYIVTRKCFLGSLSGMLFCSWVVFAYVLSDRAFLLMLHWCKYIYLHPFKALLWLWCIMYDFLQTCCK